MEILNCEYCGRPCPQGAIVLAEAIDAPYQLHKNPVMCQQCFSMVGTCNLCQQRATCPFETDVSCPLPKQVQQTIRQGNMTMQSVVKNPDRIRETCQFGCKCWSDEFGCLKENGSCGQYKEIIP